jgi:ChrR Cupin-like domain
MPKPTLEFFAVDGVPWRAVEGIPGAWERVLAVDDEAPGILTRVLHWEAGLSTVAAGPVVHEHWEEVLVLEGSMHDLTLDETFATGAFACRPPGMPHGPWVTERGCTMLEIRHRG